MAEKLLQEYTDTLYEKDSPVVVNRMHLFYNSDYGVNVLKITFRNVSALTLYGLSILVEPKDAEGNATRDGLVEYNYYGIEVPGSRAFGAAEYIVMEREAVSFDLRITRAEYGEGEVFRGDVRLKKMPLPAKLASIKDFEEPFRTKLLEYRPKLKPKYVPQEKENYWFCTCGRLYPTDIDQCRVCSLEKQWILNLYPGLVQQKKREEEEEERRRLEEEERLRLEEEQRLEEERRLQAEKEERERLEKEEAERLAREAAARKRRRKRNGLLALASMVVIITGSYLGISYKTRMQDELASMQGQMEAQAEDLDQSKSQAQKLQEQLKSQEEDLANSKTEAEKLQEQLDQKEKEAAAAQTPTPEPTKEAQKKETRGVVAKTGSSNLNMRSGPDTSFEVIKQLEPGEVVKVLGKEGDWYKIKSGKETGYVHSDYLVTVE